MHALAWVAAGYLIGTLPSTWIVSRLSGTTGAIQASRRNRGEDDAHLVVGRSAGVAWAAAAAAVDVTKGLACPLLARGVGEVPLAGVAAVGAAVVAGHAFPFYLRNMAGRGLAAAGGVFLALLPLPMIVAGLTMCAGFAIRRSGLMSTIGFGSVPLVAWIQGQPSALIAMAAAVIGLVVVRRLEGVGGVVRQTGLPPWRAALYRAVFDSSGPPLSNTAGVDGPAP